jgi:hypothetical protein
LSYSNPNNFTGNATLTVTANDQGNRGSDGAKTDSKTIALKVARDLDQ